MSFLQLAKKYWQVMTQKEREDLLTRMIAQRAVAYLPFWWGDNMTSEKLAKINNFGHLPSDLRSSLIWIVTEKRAFVLRGKKNLEVK